MNLTFTPSNAFDVKSDSITLKRYADDLLTYFSGTDVNLGIDFGQGMLTPYIPTSPDEHVKVLQDDTGFPYTFVDNGYELTYYKNNFRNFISGAIRLTVKKEDCKNDFGYQDFEGFTGVNPGTYTIFFTTTKISGSTLIAISFNVFEPTESIARLSEIINEQISNSIDDYNVITTEPIGTNTLRFRTKPDDGVAVVGYIKMASGNEETLERWFTKIHKPSYFSAPDVDTKVISFHELNSTNNEISLIHKTDGFLYLFMSDKISEYTLTKKISQWDWDNEEFKEIEINFDNSLSNVIIGGEVKAFFETVGVNANETLYDSIIRDNPETYMTLVGGGDAYGFREIDVFNQKQHCGSYSVPESVLEYDGQAYIEYHYGDMKVYDDSTLSIKGTGDFIIEAYDDGIPISYVDKDGNTVVVSSGDIDEFIRLFKGIDYDENSTLSFEPNNLTFRITYLNKGAEITEFEFDPGTPEYNANDPYNFEDLYAWVRRQCGAPQITCELTDDQIYDALCRAVEKYNKYRNWNENLNIYDLDNADPEDTTILRKGYSKEEGKYFILPAHISPKDIVDIFFQPRFSTCWFGAGDTFLNNVMAQTFFGLYGGIVQNSADYYIWRASCNDISNIIGTQISWRIYNHHLYITPGNLHDLDQFKVGIKYRPALTVEEIRNSEDIKALTLAYAMRTLGPIRGSFGGSIQAGDIAIQLNAETLLAEADKLEDKTIALLKSEQKPLWMIWS